MNYFLSFGQKHRREHHPNGGHPDGWVRIVAKDYAGAMKVAFSHFGENFANLKPENEFDRSFYPRGELWVIE